MKASDRTRRIQGFRYTWKCGNVNYYSIDKVREDGEFDISLILYENFVNKADHEMMKASLGFISLREIVCNYNIINDS